MTEAVIFDGLRSPFGRHGGALARLRPDDLGGQLVQALLAQSGVEGGAIEDVLIGNTNQAGEDSRNLARHIGLLGGLPVDVAGMTLNRLCGSGLSAIADASRCVQTGQGELFVAGGSEVMSRAPWVMARAETAFSRHQPMADSTLGSRFPNRKLTAEFGDPSMAETADNVGADLGISRKDSDAFALASQQKYAAAMADGFFEGEIVPVVVPSGSRKIPPVTVAADEHPRPDSVLEKLASLRPLNADGVVTAGNASGINDGAALVLVGNREAGERAGLEARARILTSAVAGVEPRVMGLGPVPASKKALERAGLELRDMDVIELNEAFATQVLGCLKQMGIAQDDPRLNPNGGAIAIGHPLGASGARLALTALRQLERTSGRYALVTMCIGVGQGIATVVERIG